VTTAFTHVVAGAFIVIVSFSLSLVAFMPDGVCMAIVFGLVALNLIGRYGVIVAVIEVLRGRA
jgi:hypothetical protein